MRRQIRRGVFETNSSSCHSITMCMKSDYDKWKDGKLVWDDWKQQLVPVTDETGKDNWNRYFTYEQFNDYSYIDQEKFTDEITTPGGETIVAFGYYGYDG